MKFLIQIILFLFICTNNFGQINFAKDTTNNASVLEQNDFEQQYQYAKSLYNKENFYDAITEFKRLLFFDTMNNYAFEANMLIARCYKAGGKYSDAVFYFKSAERFAKKRQVKDSIKIEIVKVNILRHTTEQAFKLLDEAGRDSTSTINKSDFDYWRGWAYIFEDDWENAASCFGRIDKLHPLKILSEKVENEKYSVTLAKLFSVFFPGAGQFYTGNYVSGIMSLGWNFLWGFISVNSFVENRIFDGVMTANFLWLRFYLGSVNNAEKFAVGKNLEITNSTLKYLQNNYNGEKP